MRNPFRRKALNASPGVIEALHERRTNFVTRLGGTNVRIAQVFNTAQTAGYGWFYDSSPAVRTVVDLIARNVAQLDLRLYKEVAVDQRQVEPDHPAAVSLRYPNSSMSSDQFIRFLVKSFLVYDNAYATKHRTGNGGPIQFVALPPEKIEVMGRGLIPEGYLIHFTDGSVSDPIPASDMLHWRGENFSDMRLGSSRLETLRSVIAEEAAMQAALYELARSGLAEPSWVSRPLEAPEWSNVARDRFEEDNANRLKRATKRPPVLEEGMELHGFGVSPRDAEMLAVRKYALQQVATLYGVPLGMVGLADDVAAAQAEFYADTLPPICEQLCRQFNLQVLNAEFNDTSDYFEFELDEKLMGDERLKALTSASGRPVLLTNEARGMLNKPPVDGGDELVTPANVFVGDNPKPSVDVMPIQDPNGPSQEGDHRIAARSNGKALLLERQKNAERRRNEAAAELEPTLKRYFNRQRRSVKSSGKAVDSDRWNTELAAELHAFYLKFGEREGRIAAERMLSTFDAAYVQNYFTAKARDVATEMNAQTLADIRDLGIDEAFTRAENVRAGGSARKAATDTAAFAVKAAAQQSGDSNRAVTITGGECEICAPYQGTWPIEELTEWPAYHNNCTCIADPL